MHRLDKDDDTVPVSIKMPLTMRDALDRSIVEEGFANRSEAARVALERGLNGGKVRKSKRAPTSNGSGCAHPVGRRIGNYCVECNEDVK